MVDFPQWFSQGWINQSQCRVPTSCVTRSPPLPLRLPWVGSEPTVSGPTFSHSPLSQPADHCDSPNVWRITLMSCKLQVNTIIQHEPASHSRWCLASCEHSQISGPTHWNLHAIMDVTSKFYTCILIAALVLYQVRHYLLICYFIVFLSSRDWTDIIWVVVVSCLGWHKTYCCC